MKSRFLLLFALLLGFTYSAYAQVTASSISGIIRDNNGEVLPGAIVELKHMPSGTVYIATSTNDGRYSVANMRVGGPYTVTTSFVGYKTEPVTDVFLSLGQPYALNITMVDASVDLGLVEVVGSRDRVLNSQRTGAATNLTTQELDNLPTISRSINDFTRLTPQAGGNNTFGGRDGRYNNITIDGANFNNNFGLSSNNLPGGNAQPISLDAIEEIQVNIAPYDVRQTNFTGAGINAVTRSGTNDIQASVYTFFRNQDMNGRRIGPDTLAQAERSTSNIYGARIGGPLIKDKLFFFVNGEFERNVRPGINFRPNAGGEVGDNISRTTVADMERVRNHLLTQYGYDPGRISDYGNDFLTQNYKALARLDWNINNFHKFTLRYTEVVNSNDQVVNGNSAPNPRAASFRISRNAFTFENGNYGFENSVRSFAAELNSTLMGGRANNQLLATFTRINDRRTSKSTPFPFVDIWEGGDAYMSFGYELFSWKNEVLNDVITITDNFTYFMGKHTITAGFSMDILTFGNSFLRYGTSHYRFASVDDFINGANPTAFGLTYSLLPGGADPVAQLDFGLAGLYIQDEYLASDKLKLTYGLRVDLPIYLQETLRNPAIEALSFQDLEGNPYQIKMEWPTQAPLFSPRVGFNYDIKGDRSMQLRGGTGIFTGRLPFVWFTNLPTNSGMIQNTVEITNAAQIENLGLQFDPRTDAHNSKFPQNAGETAPGSIASIDPNFKMPQIFRTNLGFDAKLKGGLVLTLDAIYTKDINAVFQYNANQRQPIGTLAGPDNRPLFDFNNRRVNPNTAEAMVLTNTNLGSSTALTAQLSKPFAGGFFASLAYTYTYAEDITGNPGSQAASAWTNNLAIRGQNDLDLSVSEFAFPHRVVGALSYAFQWLGAAKTTVSLFYDGIHQGRFSYRYNGDVNRDGNNADLMYIPASPSEIRFADIVVGGQVRFTAQQQSDAFFAFIEQDAYLSKNKGKYAQRNGALLPFRHRFDLRVLQDVFVKSNGKKHALQISLDILNVGNMFNPNAGLLKQTVVPNSALLVFNRIEADGQPSFRMAQVGGQLPTQTFQNVFNFASTWGAQVGVRYIFQ
jgi:hypothetical protein